MMVDTTGQKYTSDAQTSPSTIKLLSMKQPHFSKVLNQLNYQSHYEAWMNLLQECSSSSSANNHPNYVDIKSELSVLLFMGGVGAGDGVEGAGAALVLLLLLKLIIQFLPNGSVHLRR